MPHQMKIAINQQNVLNKIWISLLIFHSNIERGEIFYTDLSGKFSNCNHRVKNSTTKLEMNHWIFNIKPSTQHVMLSFSLLLNNYVGGYFSSINHILKNILSILIPYMYIQSFFFQFRPFSRSIRFYCVAKMRRFLLRNIIKYETNRT